MSSKEHDELCRRSAQFLKNNGFNVVFDDRFAPTSEQPDAFGISGTSTCLIEVKVSRSDFLADSKKWFRQEPEKGMGDWRFYLCPKGLISVDELPHGWGLLYATEKQIRKVHGWPDNGYFDYNKPFVGNHSAERSYMYSALRRMEIRGHLDDVYKGIDEL
ncbi:MULTISPECIES: hypothetical protein [unclassified Vibrio]|uniref:hypothetical protein n=1 Tax=unclassified Vibrio TaxID=2614977 RepID=UPI000B8EDDB3|nr:MULTISPECIES: hypothetical protein [unclassified Vibrio]NAX44820.1 hypothetical protein [Vibrio sp. V25_P4S6T154]OXX40925.1 hypothetical protein B9J93_21080 [Vibrio sp. V17_P4S1T151]OXX59179.1 hypothetical protein B9J89_19540 [Vibrio sp. V15_P4S5T153]OXX65419.1 hypothetical protein B9J94_15430 [Vibrio sp. V20_P4S3T152]